MTTYRKQQCPACQRWIGINCWVQHVRACDRQPDDQTIHALWERHGSAPRIAEVLHIGWRTAQRWCHAVGIDTSHGHTPEYEDEDLPERPPLAEPRFAPRWGWKRGCDFCPDHAACLRRLAVDLWPLCCIPSQHEVAWAYRDGRIGFDGRLPEWLPALLEAMQ